MNIILFDTRESWENMLPLTFTRPIAELRVGIRTIREKWEAATGLASGTFTRKYLRTKYPVGMQTDSIWINSSVLPAREIVERILKLRDGQRLEYAGQVIAFSTAGNIPDDIDSDTEIVSLAPIPVTVDDAPCRISYPWDIFTLNGSEIQHDFDDITRGRTSAAPGIGNTLIAEENLFIEDGARVNCATINASDGPVYIGRDAEIMEGSVIRGSLAMCEHSVLKLSAKVYGPSTLGPHCKVGGEINNVVFQGYSNKAHDGFLGNAVIGEWCNLGADTNNSNLKNTYQEVRVWNYRTKSFIPTGLQFCGLIMGDHSKTGINTMFNTGTIVGVSANIFGAGFPRNFIPSFSWGGAHGMKTFTMGKAFEVAQAVMARRKIDFDDTEQGILRHIFECTETNRLD